MKEVKVERLNIRLKGIPYRIINNSVNGLSNELLAQLSKQEGLLKNGGTIRINKIDSGVVKAQGKTNYVDLRGMIVNKIVGAILQKTQEHKEKR